DLNANRFTNPGEIPGNNIDDDNNGWVDDVNTGINTLNGAANAYPPLDLTQDPGFGHGTNVTGIAAAVGNNKIGIAGNAFNAKFVPVRFIEALRGDQGLIGGDLGEALSFAYLNQFVGVSNQSYGIPSANNLGPEGPLAKAALQQAATTGRGGKGTVFV